VRAALGTAAGRDSAPTDSAKTLRELTELHDRGVVTDAEFETLRADLRV
jgi:Short C-terminal domain